MTKERKTQIVTVLVLTGAFGVVLAQKTGWKLSEVKVSDIVQRSPAKPEPSPQDAIYAMLDAARVGDVKAYLTSYTGQMDAALKQSLAETTEAGFAKYLKDSNAAVKGIAISEPQTVTDREVKCGSSMCIRTAMKLRPCTWRRAPGVGKFHAWMERSGSKRWYRTERRFSELTFCA